MRGHHASSGSRSLILLLSLVLSPYLGGCASQHVSHYPDGSLQKEGLLVWGLQEGEWRFYHEAGGLQQLGPYAEDIPDGWWTCWHTNRQPELQGAYAGQKRTGPWRSWYETGAPNVEGYYLDGEKIGPWRSWNPPATRLYPVPDGHELIREGWPEGPGVRREGVVQDGQRIGQWVLRHPDGKARLTGRYERGEATGEWTGWSADGQPLGRAELQGGVRRGDWVLQGDARADALDAWLEEMNAELTGVAPTERPGPSIPRSEAVELETEVEIDMPVVPTPDWTVREKALIEELVSMYGTAPPRSQTRGRYRPRVRPGPRGNPRGAALVGQGIPASAREFRSAREGQLVRLDDLKGQRILLVILRGFGSQVCVYCATQARAYAEESAYVALREKRDIKVLVVYPGPERGVQAFRDAYRRSFDALERPSYDDFLFDQGLELVYALNIQDTLARPTTLFLDEEGVVRYAYVGDNAGDRPSIQEVIQAIDRVDAP